MSVSYTSKRNKEINTQGQSHTHCIPFCYTGRDPDWKPGIRDFIAAVFYGWDRWKLMLTKGISHLFALHCKEGILSHLNSFLYFSFFILIMSQWAITAQIGKYSWQIALLESNVSSNDHLIQRWFSYCINSSFKKNIFRMWTVVTKEGGPISLLSQSL